jgi:2Fe-2S ferredoxin
MPKVTILPDNRTIEVEPGTTLLEASERAGAMHGSACGGVCGCSGCHVWVRRGLDSLSEASDRELDRLDGAFDVRSSSRLGCQAEVGTEDVEFEIAPESLEAWLDEHPEERRRIEAGQLPEDASAELRARLQKYVRGQGGRP